MQSAAYDELGAILVDQGRLAEAESNYRLLVRPLPSADAHRKLAEVLMRLGRTDEARTEMKTANALGAGEAR